MFERRPGSILATSISLVAVFLTITLGSMAYVQNRGTNAFADKWRVVADQAARSGLDFVLGYGEANIDDEVKLPRAWDAMVDDERIDPVSLMLKGGNADAVLTASNPPAATDFPQPGQMLGGAAVGEYVIGREGPYVISFKARIQQFRISENMPRQYRIGVVGRVRRIQPDWLTTVSTDERSTVLVERVLVAFIGKVPVSRYAALIDIDGVKNWVPGEVTNGPVHINRGYVDSDEYTKTAAGVTVGGVPIATGTLTGPDLQTKPAKELRSAMNLFIAGETGNPGFDEVNSTKFPVFNAEVTMTETVGDADYPHQDPDPHSTTEPTQAIRINAEPYDHDRSTPLGTDLTQRFGNKIFRAAENQIPNRYTNNGSFEPGPVMLRRPIVLPTSVRGRLTNALGAPNNLLNDINWHKNLPDGLYLPTPLFWKNNGGSDEKYEAADLGSAYDAQPLTGGIYIRGNVEVMRMGVEGAYSIYIFQLGNTGAKCRVYVVAMNRTTKETWLKVFAAGKRLGDPDPDAPPMGGTLATYFGGTGSLTTEVFTTNSDVNAYRMDGPAGASIARFTSPGSEREFPFNGVIFVDLAQTDRARLGNIKRTPITGNIFALGDPTPTVADSADVNALGTRVKGNPLGDGSPQERVATYLGTNTAARASKLTIMAMGNIFIQNHLVLNSIAGLSQIDPSAGLGIGLAQCKDLLGLVSDKQVVIGLAAPSSVGNNRTKVGLIIDATIAALGDPGLNYDTNSVPTSEKIEQAAYRGSFGVEGLQQQFLEKEDYKMAHDDTILGPTYFTSVAGNVDAVDTYITQFNAATQAINDTLAVPAYSTLPTLNNAAVEYPGDPIYTRYNPLLDEPLNNPNRASPRGKLMLFGGVTQKKRGILGLGNLSYDKDLKFDRRLLTIAPPVFPSSTNLVFKVASPFSPDPANLPRRLLYFGTGGHAPDPAAPGDLDFLYGPPGTP